MTEYQIPFQAACAEYVEKRSRFIGQLWPVSGEEEARARIEEAKKQYYDARHHCWCYLLREGGVLRYSDDGEPQGTAGQPIMNVFLREEVTNVCCVVTRYFGGILLGAGGLTRAYGAAAKLALDASGVSRMQLWSVLGVSCAYALYERLCLLTEQCAGAVEKADFGAEVLLTVALPAAGETAFREKVTELTAGAVQPLLLEQVFRPGPRQEAK